MAMSPSAMFTSDRARAALTDIMEAFATPINVERLHEAKRNAGNDMLLYMQLVFPLATQIQLEVIKNYGFTSDKEGLLQFTHSVKLLRKESLEVSHMDDELRQILLPSLTLPYAPVPVSGPS